MKIFFKKKLFLAKIKNSFLYFFFHKNLKQLYKSFIKKGDLCFDLGANIGYQTKIISELVGKEGNVVAVEPQQSSFKKLEKKFKEKKNVSLIMKAISEKKEMREFYINELNLVSTLSKEYIKNSQKSNRLSQFKWEKKEIVECITLQHLINQFGIPQFCKIDIEGFEYKAIKTLKVPINILSIEFTKEEQKNIFNCVDHLSNLGQYLFNYSIGEKPTLQKKEWVDAAKIKEEISSIKREKTWGNVLAKKQQPSKKKLV